MFIMLRPITAKIKTCGQATEPQTNQHSCLQFSFLTPDWFFSCTTITFQKYFRCSQFSQLCSDHRIGKNCFHFFNQNEVFCSGFFQLTFGVNSSIQELGDVITKVPPGATRDGNLSRNWYGLGRRQTKFAARTQPNCPKSDGKLQASP